MKRTVFLLIVLLAAYQATATTMLYTSDYFNVISYYTEPPKNGNIELGRLPIFFGDSTAILILRNKQSDAERLIRSGGISLAAALTSYEHSASFPEKEARRRAFKVADLLIAAGYDPMSCEQSKRSTAQVLKDWGHLDSEMRGFLLKYIPNSELFNCR